MPEIKYQLVVRTGPNPNVAYELDQPVVYIGRDPNNDISINDLEISRRHARLTVQSGGYILEDLGSTNGTFVGGQRLIGPHLLRPGELIALGEKILLSFEAVSEDPGATMVSGPVRPSYGQPVPKYQEPPRPSVPTTVGQDYAAPAQPPALSPRPASSMPASSQAGQPASVNYSGQIPESPAAYSESEPPQRSSRTLIILGVGCLVLFLCVCVGSAIFFDSLTLYCVPPFDSLFNWLYTCPAG